MGFLGRPAKQAKRLKASAKQLLVSTTGLEPLHFVRSGYWALDGVIREWPSLSGPDGIVDPPLESWHEALNHPEAASRALRIAAFSAAGFSSLAHKDYGPLDRLEGSLGIEADHEASIGDLARSLDEEHVVRFWRGTLESLLGAAEATVPAGGYTNLPFIHFWSGVISENLQASNRLSNRMVSEFGPEQAEAVLKHLAE